MAWLVPHTLRFPKSQRGVLARKVQAQLFAMYEALVDAGLSDAPLPHLRRADASLTKLRAYLRLCRDLRLLSIPQYGYASQQVAQVGRLLGGWFKSLERGKRPRGRSRQKAVPAS